MDQQRTAPPPIDVARLNLLLVGLLLTGLALYVVVQTMRGGTNALVTATVLIGGVIWMVAGRRVWWMPIPIAASIGGLVWVGFRIYSHELAVLLACIALFPAIAINSRLLEQHRAPLPKPVYLLLVYLAFHLFASLVMNRMSGGGGYGNIVRTYVSALWPLLFVTGVYHYGDSRLLRTTVRLIYIALLFRVAVGLYSYYFPGFIFFRGFNAFFLLSEHGAMELRDAPLKLLILSLALCASTKRTGTATLHLTAALFSAWLLLMGSSRVTVAMLMVVPALWLLIQRRFALILLLAGIFISAILAINANPDILNQLPRGPQRALSILVFGEMLDIQAKLAGSNQWHQELFKLGAQRWMDSGVTFLFGNRVHPFDLTGMELTYDFFHRIQVAASIARYERSLWTILATTGLTGGLLYLSCFFVLLRGPVRELRRNLMPDFNHAIYFIATAHAFLFLLFSPFHGSFPGPELMWAGIAFTVYQDQRRNNLPNPTPSPQSRPAQNGKKIFVGRVP